MDREEVVIPSRLGFHEHPLLCQVAMKHSFGDHDGIGFHHGKEKRFLQWRAVD